MPQRRILRHLVTHELYREHIALLSDEPLPTDADKAGVFRFLVADGRKAQLWPRYAEVVVLRWIAGAPGTRPRLWWKFSAPEPRRMIAGEGEPLELDPRICEFGIPTKWKSIDPRNPPLFEAQATYLRRLKLCVANESRRLRAQHFLADPLSREFWPRETLKEPTQ